MNVKQFIDSGYIEDLYDGRFRRTKPNYNSIFLARHCDRCNEPHFVDKTNDNNVARLLSKKKNANYIPSYCSKGCLNNKTKDNCKELFEIRDSIKDSTKEVVIFNKTYKREDIPKTYINHFASKDITLAFKRWIYKLHYHNSFRDKARVLSESKNEKINKKLEMQTMKIEYWESYEGKLEKKRRKYKVKMKRRKDDMIRYYSNPIKYSLKRLLLHCIKAEINNKPYEKSSDIIDYKKCAAKLKYEAESFGLSIKKMKELKSHIDHIIPISLYDGNDKNELMKCFNYQNLRWLSAHENISKNNKLRAEDIEVIKTLPTDIYPKQWNGVIPN